MTRLSNGCSLDCRNRKSAVHGKPEAYRNVQRQSRNCFTAHRSLLTSLSAFCLLPSATVWLLTRLKTNRLSTSTNSVAFAAFAFTFANAAAEPASMGRGDFVSRTAFGSHARDRADRIWRDLVCD